MNTIKILTLSVIFVLYWGCTEDTPLGISPHELDTPDSNPTIPASDYTNGTNFSKFCNTITIEICFQKTLVQPVTGQCFFR